MKELFLAFLVALLGVAGSWSYGGTTRTDVDDATEGPARSPCGTPAECSSRGDDYYYGRGGVSPDPGQAASLYGKGCDGGDALGCTKLAVMYEQGEAVPQDPGQAIALYHVDHLSADDRFDLGDSTDGDGR